MKPAVTVILLILGSSRLFAQEADYKTYFKDGAKLYSENKYKESADKFQQSFKLQKNAKTAWFIAVCYFKRANCDSAVSYSKFALDHRKELDGNDILQCEQSLDKCGYAVSYRRPAQGSTYTHVNFTLSTSNPRTDVNSKAINSDAARQKQLLKGNKTKADTEAIIVKRKVDTVSW
ncbi:hypothetical protein [Mucilaginibacter ginsenosidivorax]|uniref:Tetratricopeptide repeat protein n=1 Tax=Mucilaginibacter ginsenosidivorax TaxID=862126 RepID=A0A5B8VZ28_9SPHI|nr:hypothetical protein [Mucilaginibacter ginsenosidivorax]QEC75865.1 hypothetical protein FSB76_07860 [Mucilaginibacter ginsenosidivorax]